MLFDDTYRTIGRPGEGIFRDKGSKFIGYAFATRTEDELKDRLAAIRAEHPKARHYCWAARFTTDRSVFKLNDDGEPSGSAGRPILNTLLSQDLTNVAVIVVRYFGGTLLGIPGLINAYKAASIEALKASEIVELNLTDVYSIHFDYLQMNAVMRILKDNDLRIIEQVFDNDCTITIEIRKSILNQVLAKMDNTTSLSYKYLYSN
ncbi:putative YigZ family protein [Arcticibacter pallidicorallinus]|uniref:Putative YigZ family protein n=1 Tax=Arcticibacter pallidicorallinus TaxID=1259464 RepID=A0A2T0U2W6_9SPHI|nr:YigZ family protein [Arcticibacter pallidicorallinus]PRY52261.1 putative YigZ family protein [Arcticibacter pallidicorallinus]